MLKISYFSSKSPFGNSPLREDKVFGLLALLVFFVPLIFSLFTFENFEAIKFSMFALILGAAVISFLFKPKNQAENTIPVSLAVLLGLFLFWTLLAAVFGMDLSNSIIGFYYRFANGLLFYCLWAAFIFLLVKILTPEKKRVLAEIFIFDALVVAVVGLFQSIGIGYYEGLSQGGFVRAPSLLGNPNFSSLFMAMALPYAVYFLIFSVSGKLKIYYGTLSLILLLSLTVMSSRGSLLALFAGAALWAVLYLKTFFSRLNFFKSLAVLILGLGLCFSLLEAVRPGTFRKAWSLTDLNTILRLDVWRISALGIVDKPLLGVGPGNFQIFFEQAGRPELAGSSGEFDDAHNLFLHLAVTGGLPLLAVFLSLLLWPIKKNFLRLAETQELGIANITAIIIFIVGAFFNPVSLGCFVALGLVLSLAWADLQYPSSSPRLPRLTVSMGIVFGALCALFGLSLLIGEVLIASAVREYNSGNFASASHLSTAAVAVHPLNSFYRVYKIGSQIKVHKNMESIPSQITAYINKHPKESRSWLYGAKFYFLLYNETNNINFLNRAEDSLKMSLKLDPYYKERYGLLAVYQFVNHDLAGAQESLNYALTQDDKNFSFWLLKARVSQIQGQKTRAIFALNKAYELHPEFSKLKIELAALRSATDVKLVPIEVLFNVNKLD